MTSDSEPPAFTLQLVEGPLAGRTLQKDGTSFRVGRTKQSALQIKDGAVSEKHAEIRFLDGHWQIKDLGSSNGTMLNGADVTDDFVKLKSGDMIKFGTDSVAKVEIAVKDTDTLTVQSFIEAEAERVEQHLRSHAEQIANGLRNSWIQQKAQIIADL